MKPCILTIAGSDSSGGAGIQADIKTISALNGYAASVITAVTAQNTLGVQAIYPLPARFVKKQLESVFSDLNIDAIKIGMLHNKNIIAATASMVKKFNPPFVVLDPVMKAKNGCDLLDQETLSFFQETLFPLATLITPNLPETELLLQTKIYNREEQALACMELSKKFKIHVLVKGGHFSGELASDVLYHFQNKKHFWFHEKRILSNNTHGTGCSLSSAIACYLAKNFSLQDSVQHAKKYLTNAILFGKDLNIGDGFGPIEHFFILAEK